MSIKVREGGQWVQVSDGGGGFVTGMIMMFSGTTAPTGWVLCDNSAAAQAANAPDLRDRFVVGTGSSYNLGDADGSANAVVVSHTHGVSHSHGVSHTHGMSHTHPAGTLSGSSKSLITSTKVFQYGGDAVGAHGWASGGTSITGSTATSSISNTGSSSISNTGSSSISNTGAATNGVAGTNANLPPYYALAFIMKT